MRRKALLSFILLFLIFSLGIGTTYSYFAFRISYYSEEELLSLSSHNININFINGSEVLIDSTHESVTKNITIQNNSDTDYGYNLSFFNVTNTLTSNTMVKYAYTCASSSGVCESRSDLNSPTTDDNLTNVLTIPAGVTHTYEIVFMRNGTLNDKYFSANINTINVQKESYTLLARTGYGSTESFYSYGTSISEIIFESEINIPSSGVINQWDVSVSQDGGIIAYLISDGLGAGTYDLYIQSDGNILANPNSRYYFSELNVLTTITNLSLLDTSNVTSFQGLFYCTVTSNLVYADLSSFNTTNVTDMSFMFAGCTKLESLDFSSFSTPSLIDMSGMFNGCNTMEIIDLSTFNTSLVTSFGNLFYNCIALTDLDISSFDTGNVEWMNSVFKNCSLLTSIDVRHFDTSSAYDMFAMFEGCSGLTSIDLSSFDTSNVGYMSYMFNKCSGLTSIDLSMFNTSNVTDMEAMFYKCTNIISLDLSTFNTSNVETMYFMFGDCTNLVSVNLSTFNTSKVTTISNMFFRCSSLLSLNLSNFTTPQVTDMSFSFSGCSSLSTLNLSTFNTSNVTNLNQMFFNCSSLTSVNLSSFITSKVNLMSFMFMGCSSLTTLDLSTFTAPLVTSTAMMFSGCTSLTSVNFSSASFTSVTSYTTMFTSCPNGIVITVLNTQARNFMRNRLTDSGVTGTVNVK